MRVLFYICLLAIAIAFFCTACSSGSSHEDQAGQNEQTLVKYTQIDTTGNVISEVVPPSKITKHGLIMRSSDFSCLSASLATILKYSFNENATEETVMQGMLTYGNTEEINQRKAFSLLDMKTYLEAIGYTGTGYKIVDGISLSQLQNDTFDSFAQVSITPIEIAGVKRFVVLRGYDQNNIYLGDPSNGNICMSIQNYAGVICDNTIFVVGRNDSSQEESFILYETKPSMRYMKHIDDASMAEIF